LNLSQCDSVIRHPMLHWMVNRSSPHSICCRPRAKNAR
jgi:hypothetical protein